MCLVLLRSRYVNKGITDREDESTKGPNAVPCGTPRVKDWRVQTSPWKRADLLRSLRDFAIHVTKLPHSLKLMTLLMIMLRMIRSKALGNSTKIESHGFLNFFLLFVSWDPVVQAGHLDKKGRIVETIRHHYSSELFLRQLLS